MLRTTAAAIVTAAAAAALAAPATAAPAPVQVTLSDAQCKDLSSAVAMLPPLQAAFPDPAHTPTIEYRIQTAPDAPSTPYEFKINGERKGSGEVGPKGLVMSSTAIPNNRTVVAEVTSGDKVLATRTYHPSC